jgi:hypothetical protein
MTFSSKSLPSGTHTRQAVVRDPTTMVRNDPSQLLADAVTWTVTKSAGSGGGCGRDHVLGHHLDLGLDADPTQRQLVSDHDRGDARRLPERSFRNRLRPSSTAGTAAPGRRSPPARARLRSRRSATRRPPATTAGGWSRSRAPAATPSTCNDRNGSRGAVTSV